jgi:hypothetical protein
VPAAGGSSGSSIAHSAPVVSLAKGSARVVMLGLGRLGPPGVRLQLDNLLESRTYSRNGVGARGARNGFVMRTVKEGVYVMVQNVTIPQAIEQLRVQLAEAQAQLASVQQGGGPGKDIAFLTKSVEVELVVVLKSEVAGSGGVKAWFVDVSGTAKSADETTHRVKLVLEPVGPDGKSIQVSDTGP